MSNHAADQIKADNIAKMGNDIGVAYSAIWQEVAWIHNKWDQYDELFGTSSKRIDILNQAAPSLFRTIQDSLWDDILLHLARLTDRPKSMGKTNLSVCYLAELIVDPTIKQQTESHVNCVLNACEFARDWRNRRLAHRDLDLALEKSAQPLASASRSSVKAALKAFEDFLNVISLHYLGSQTNFDLASFGEDAVSLLYLLRDGLKYRDELRARIRRGEADWKELRSEAL